MPLYDLICDCGHTKEVFLHLDEKEPECDKCGSCMRRAMSAPAFHLKGNGWYKDHYGLKKEIKNVKID
jgi:putative FmdB family regulatory protein